MSSLMRRSAASTVVTFASSAAIFASTTVSAAATDVADVASHRGQIDCCACSNQDPVVAFTFRCRLLCCSMQPLPLPYLILPLLQLSVLCVVSDLIVAPVPTKTLLSHLHADAVCSATPYHHFLHHHFHFRRHQCCFCCRLYRFC